MPDGDDVIEQEIRVAAPPETVFPYFTDPERMRRWKGVDLKLDPHPGGIYRCDMDGRHVARGEYVEVSPPHRVRFTSIGAGTTEVQKNIIADRAIKMPRR